jgi:hypothetical protein
MPENGYNRRTLSAHTLGRLGAEQFRRFADPAEKLKMDVTVLMRQRNRKVAPSKTLVKCLAKEPDIDESLLNRPADEVRKNLG